MEDSNTFPTETNKFFYGSSLLELLRYVEICKHYLARKKVALVARVCQVGVEDPAVVDGCVQWFVFKENLRVSYR